MRKNDAGFKNLLRNLKTGSLKVEAGIFRDAKASRSANGSAADNLAYRLQIHDQGLGNNPQRQVLQPALQATESDIQSSIAAQLQRLDRSQGFGAVAQAAGARLAAQIQKEFTQTSPPKKASTIRAAQRRYGGIRNSNLIQTGEMRLAVRSRVTKL